MPTPVPPAGTVNSARCTPVLRFSSILHRRFQRVFARRQSRIGLIQEVPHLVLVGGHVERAVAGDLLHHFALGVLDQRRHGAVHVEGARYWVWPRSSCSGTSSRTATLVALFFGCSSNGAGAELQTSSESLPSERILSSGSSNGAKPGGPRLGRQREVSGAGSESPGLCDWR